MDRRRRDPLHRRCPRGASTARASSAPSETRRSIRWSRLQTKQFTHEGRVRGLLLRRELDGTVNSFVPGATSIQSNRAACYGEVALIDGGPRDREDRPCRTAPVAFVAIRESGEFTELTDSSPHLRDAVMAAMETNAVRGALETPKRRGLTRPGVGSGGIHYPVHPTRPVPPAMPGVAVTSGRPHVDPVRGGPGRRRRRCRWRARRRATPTRARRGPVPVPVPQLPVTEDGEDL